MLLEPTGSKKNRKSKLPDGKAPSKWVSWSSEPWVQRLAIALVTALLVAFFSMEFVRLPQQLYAEGDIASRDVRASVTVNVVDDAATEELENQAVAQVLPVFDYNPNVAQEAERRVQETYAYLRQVSQESRAKAARAKSQAAKKAASEAQKKPGAASPEGLAAGDMPSDPSDSNSKDPKNSDNVEAVDTAAEMALDESDVQQVLALLGVDVPVQAVRELGSARFDESIEQGLRQGLRDALSGYVVFSDDVLPGDLRASGISVVVLGTSDPQELILHRRDQIETVTDARRRIELSLQRSLSDRNPALVQSLVTVSKRLVRSNLTPNARETENRRIEARESVRPATYTIKKGTMIARAGDPIDKTKLKVLNGMSRARDGYRSGLTFVAKAAWCLLVLLIVYQFASRFVRKFVPTLRDVLVMALILVFVLGLARLGMEIAHALAASTGGIPVDSYYYLLPMAAGAMLVRILMNSETALVFAIVMSAFTAMILDYHLFMSLFVMVSSLTAAGGISHTKERLHVLRSGVFTGIVSAGFALSIAIVQWSDVTLGIGGGGAIRLLTDSLFAFCGGVAAGIIVLGLLPIFETFGYVTDNKLLELANLNHPLLKEMMVQAPGSYHHSVIVGSLSEAACEAIGANALLARVGCYFHDIGKMKKASYFIENIRDQENKHDRLAPSMSALIIASHVKDGIELGRRFRLPQPIIDLIPQHHGTALISFFYNKAKQMEDLDLSPVDENDYRYPGPRPQTKEAGIVMVADAVEASTRSIKQPTSAKIRANIQKILSRVLADGQLDECPLTLKDLGVIADTFHSVLLGIYHSRIQYPAEYKPKGRRAAGVVNMPDLGKRLTATQELSPSARDSLSGTRTAEHLPVGRKVAKGDG